ncbi:MAG: hypothetical protein AAB515_01325 [Patescibacteria group bacterium]
MIPRAEIIYNHDYAERLYRGQGTFKEAWQDLVFRGEVFERVFDQAIVPILQAIPQVTGLDWSADHAVLPIYMIADGESFAAPLTLAVTTDVEGTLFELIQLLARVNLQTGFPSAERRDHILLAIAEAVAARAELTLVDAVAATDLAIREKYGVDTQPVDWDLRTNTAKHYLEKK